MKGSVDRVHRDSLWTWDPCFVYVPGKKLSMMAIRFGFLISYNYLLKLFIGILMNTNPYIFVGHAHTELGRLCRYKQTPIQETHNVTHIKRQKP